jgi:hypothetical protein
MLTVPTGGTYYDVNEAAAILGVSSAQVIRYCEQGLLAYFEDGKAGRGVRRKIAATALDSFERPARGRPKEVE